MATLVLTAVGTAIGGPIGGAIGSIIGQQVDRSLFGGGSREGPRLKELSVTTSSYGQPIPRIFGRMRTAGTVIWSTELKETTKKEGGGKGRPSTKTYSYSASFAVALASTPIERIGRIWADGNLLRGAGDDLKVEGAMRIYPGSGDSPLDPLISADRGTAAPAFRDCAYVVFENLQLGDFGNRIPALTFEVFAIDNSTVSLAQLVPQGEKSAGDLVLQHARGFADEGGAIGGSLATIDRVLPITCVTTSNGLSLTSRSSLPGSIPTLPEQLSRRTNEGAIEPGKRRGNVKGTEPLALRYYDEERDYQPGVQRALGLRGEGREAMVDLPATMTAHGARQLANNNASRLRWRDEQMTWRVSDLDPRFSAGSVVKVPEMSGFWLVRSWEWFDQGIELTLDRLPPDPGSWLGGDSGAANSPSDLISTPSILTVFELPPHDSANTSDAMVYAAVTSSGPGWRGATLFVERAGTLSAIGSADSIRAVTGTLASELEASEATLFLPNAAIDIDLPADDLAFAGTDMTGLALGSNRLLVGHEVIQFLDATPVGANRWRLTGLLRGRAGTEDAAIVGHSPGAPVVLLDDTLTQLDGSQVPSIIGTRISAIGRGDNEPVFAELLNAGASRRPPMPVSPKQRELPDGTWLFCWTRRARGRWLWPETSEVPLVEEQESYTVGYGSCEAPLAVWSVDVPEFSITLAERADLLNSFGSATLWARQVGTFSASNALLLTTLN